jgi:hypothetical protein
VGHSVPGGFKYRDLNLQVGRGVSSLRQITVPRHSDPRMTALANERDPTSLLRNQGRQIRSYET